MKKEYSEFIERLARARFSAIERMPYLSAGLYGLKTIITEQIPAKAGVTSFGRMLVNPEKCKNLTDDMIGTILLHETMHILSDHFDRSKMIIGCEPERANIANDSEINDDLISAGCVIPTNEKGDIDIVLPNQYGAETGLTFEEYYELLADKMKTITIKVQCGSGAGNPFPNEEQFDDGTGGLTKEEIERIKTEVASAITEHGRQAGFVPAGLKRWAEKITQGKPINWKKQLAQGIKKIIGTTRGLMNPTYGRISRRQHLSKEILFPSYNTVIPKIGVLVDTSGSMSEKDIGEGLYQIKKILSQMPESEIWVAIVDAEVHSLRKAKSVRDIEARLTGGGGTVFTQVFKDLDEKDVSCIVGISDCCAYFPEEPPRAKVIWITSYENPNPPFGIVIKING